MNEDEEQSIQLQIEALLKDAIGQRATDIHLESFRCSASIRFRIDGVLKKHKDITPTEYDALADRFRSLANVDRATKGPQDARMHVTIDETEHDIRMSIMPASHVGQSIVMRIIGPGMASFTLSQLGLNGDQQQQFRRWYTKSQGLVLVNGPTGSGKTTLLYSVLSDLNSESLKVVSLEDPVECAIPGINQFPIEPRVGITFENTMRASLRQDPDVIMVGEIRNQEMAQLLIQMALTGHLALSTLHSTNATSGVIRLRDIGVVPFLIADTLIGICSLRLVRKLCTACRKEYIPNDPALQAIGFQAGPYYRAEGCERCNHIGYTGRTGVFEFFELSDCCKELLFNGGTATELRKQAIRDGMETMLMDGIRKAAEGITSPEEVVRVLGNAT